MIIIARVLFLHVSKKSASFVRKEILFFKAFIGYDGRVSLENKNLNKIGLSEFYAKSSTAQLPLSNCYGFKLLDKGWRVEMEVLFFLFEKLFLNFWKIFSQVFLKNFADF